MDNSPPPQNKDASALGDTQGLMGWTKEEKYYLLQGIKDHTSKELHNIHEYVPSKSCEEIKTAIDFYKKKAKSHPIFQENIRQKKSSKKKHETQSPLSSWAKLLNDRYNYKQLCTETSTAISLIADLENLPEPASTDNIDFKMVYQQIANAMEGKPIAADNNTTAVIHKCIIDTSLASKAFMKSSTFKYILNSLDMSDEVPNINFLQATEDQELTTLRHLISNKSYNPFGIEETYLSHLSDKICDNASN